MVAAAEKNIPIVVPDGKTARWEIFLHLMLLKDELKATTMKSGIEYMVWLADWYRNNSVRAKELDFSRSVEVLPAIFRFA